MADLIKILLLMLVLTAPLSYAESPKSPSGGADLQANPDPTFWEHEKDNILSPINTPAAWILGTGTALSYMVYRDTVDKGKFGYTEDHKTSLRGDWKYWGNILGWGAFQVGYTLIRYPYIQDRDEKALRDVEMMWKSTLYTSMTTLVLKLAVTEQRRNAEHKFESFPSGHASAAFAFATNVALRHEWYWNFVSVPLALLATLSRVEDDSHYVHDSIFGAALGTSFALGMYYVENESNAIMSFVPKEDGGGVQFSWPID